MKKRFKLLLVLSVFALLLIFSSYWINTQPVWIQTEPIDSSGLKDLPSRNEEIVRFIESNGRYIAPVYNDVVCTEFVIRVLDIFDPLTPEEKKKVRIITNEDLSALITHESSVIKGVQTALVQGRKGVEISELYDVRPGDFVQFWNSYQGENYGHCGVVLKIKPNESITVYSSHPLTRGFGRQTFRWPDKVYFARLK